MDAPQLIITLDPTTKGVNVHGPIGDKTLSYGMLEMARDAIKDYNDRILAERGNIVEAHVVPPTAPQFKSRNGS